MSNLPANASGSSARATITDCWNKIGVRGDSSCRELEEHVHCRNCPVHAAAAVALLDREMPGQYNLEVVDVSKTPRLPESMI